MIARLGSIRWPRWLLVAAVAASLLARVALLDEPCRAPCRTAGDHVLVFDEVYYVGAARVIAGLPALAGQQYAGAPTGEDPNSEHPQLVKLLMAGGIELLGDGPLAWRWVSLVAGTLAVLGMWALARAAGGTEAVAAVAAFLLAADNLMIVHGRIGTLDMPALAGMVWAVALALRHRACWPRRSCRAGGREQGGRAAGGRRRSRSSSWPARPAGRCEPPRQGRRRWRR